MRLEIVSLMLDGMPFLHRHLEQFNRLTIPWHWTVVSGVAEPVGCTSWCQKMEPRLSVDGSHEFMLELAANHPRVSYSYSPSWPGKVSMLNHALLRIDKPGLLLEVDIDECWQSHQLEAMVTAFEKNPERDCAYFKCRYFCGPNIVLSGDGQYGNKPGEWLRAWRYTPGARFLSHEPPVLSGSQRRPFLRDQTEKMGLVFDHFAYAYKSQVQFKEKYYGYAGSVLDWSLFPSRVLQWPVRAGDFLPWIKDGAMADQLYKD